MPIWNKLHPTMVLLSMFLMLAISFPAFAGLEDLLPSQNVRRVGVYSGTFDPPHEGHKQLLKEAIRLLSLDVMIVIPNFQPSHKSQASPFDFRREMTELAFGDIPGVRVASMTLAEELKDLLIQTEIDKLAGDHPEMEIFRIIGEDILNIFKAKGYSFVSSNAIYAVGRRTEEKKSLSDTIGSSRVVMLDFDPVAGLSSTKIRDRIGRHEPVSAGELNPQVLALIQRRRAYQIQCETLLLTSGM